MRPSYTPLRDLRPAWRVFVAWIVSALVVLQVAAVAGGETTPPSQRYVPGGPEGNYRAYEPHQRRATSLLTPPAPDPDAVLPASWSNGGSANVQISQDNRNARLIAFDSEASNFVAGDDNGVRDVFVIRRSNGAANFSGEIAMASVTNSGAPANGSSSHPSLDGDTWHAPHCVAFESTATNLSDRARGGASAIYLRDLRSNRTSLLSPGVVGAHAPVVDGRCETVVFSARGSIWIARVRDRAPIRIAIGADPDIQTNGGGIAYVRSGQVWYRSVGFRGRRLVLGPGRLVSATAKGRPANGPSGHPALDDRGYYVAFESRASNLCVRQCELSDSNGAISDIFRRTLSRRAPTRDRMQIVSTSRFGYWHPGPSNNPVISANGENIVFDSAGFIAHSKDSYNPNGSARSLFTWTEPHATGKGNLMTVTPRPHCVTGCKSDEEKPAMSSRGNYVAYVAQMSEFCVGASGLFDGERPDCPGFQDVFITYMGNSHEGYHLG